MKKLFILIIVLLIFITPAVLFAGDAKKVDVTAENQFTDELIMPGPGLIAISDTGSMSMTVSLQIKLGGNWIDTGDTWTAGAVVHLEDGCNMTFRAGVKTGDFTSGTATIYLITQER